MSFGITNDVVVPLGSVCSDVSTFTLVALDGCNMTFGKILTSALLREALVTTMRSPGWHVECCGQVVAIRWLTIATTRRRHATVILLAVRTAMEEHLFMKAISAPTDSLG